MNTPRDKLIELLQQHRELEEIAEASRQRSAELRERSRELLEKEREADPRMAVLSDLVMTQGESIDLLAKHVAEIEQRLMEFVLAFGE